MKLFFLPLILLTALSLPALAGSPGIDQIPLATTAGDISLKSLRGKVIYLDFWASWCAPCRKSFPWMNEMHRKYSDAGFVILAVNVEPCRLHGGVRPGKQARLINRTEGHAEFVHHCGGRQYYKPSYRVSGENDS
jgi:hypothetical protein